MKKVLIIVTKSNMGGAQRYVYDVATHLPKDLFEVVVAAGPAQGSSEPGKLLEMLNTAGIRTIYLPSLARDVGLADLAAYRELLATIRTEKPNILHLNSSKAGGLGALAGRRARIPHIIFTSHGLAYDEPRWFFQKFLIFLATWATFLLCHRVIAISDYIASRARRLPGVAHRVRRVLNGLDAVPFLPKDAARKRLQEIEPHIQEDIPLIGSIAELVPNKNLSVAIEACAILKERGKKFAYTIIGSGDERIKLEQLIREKNLENCVFLLGAVPEARNDIRAFDIFLLPSIKEGVPYVLLEAAQAKVPIVGSDIPGIRTIIGSDSGLLAPSHDAELMSVAIAQYLESPKLRASMSDNLARSVASRFSIERMIRETSALY